VAAAPTRPPAVSTTTDQTSRQPAHGSGGSGPPDPAGRSSSSARAGRHLRDNLATRCFHGATVVVVGVLLGTGWWLRTGHEGRPSLLADVLAEPDTEIHSTAGWVLLGLAGMGVTLGVRGAWTFVRETVRIDRGDGLWFLRWPAGVLTRRLAPHRGHFDPGQRLLNLGIVGSLGTLIVTGIALTTLSGGSTFATMVRVHRGTTYVLTALVAGHLVVVSGILPAYRGVWRAMVTGRVPRATTRRLWPAEVPEHDDEAPAAR
jgi:cytochrome b subunit of formate dehydrogenase